MPAVRRAQADMAREYGIHGFCYYHYWFNGKQLLERPFNEVLQYFAIERFLYRLAKSPHADKFVLKGAVMFVAWQAPISRPTMAIDLLGLTNNSIDAIVVVTQESCTQVVEPDALTFEPESVEGERIVEDADYAGVRVRFRGSLGTARITMQLDIGFGDVVVPHP